MWQLIETAPKDGTRILGTFPRAVTNIYWWTPEGFVSDVSAGAVDLTHWMPVPADPTDTTTCDDCETDFSLWVRECPRCGLRNA